MPLLRLARRSFLLWFGAAFLCFGAVFLYLAVRDATRQTEYQKKGVVVDAVVVSKSIRRAAREGNTSTKYDIAYRFRTDDGRTIEGIDAVGVDEWERLEPGRSFKITYLPGAPESSRAEGSGGMGSPLVMAIVGSGLALVGGIIVWISGRHLAPALALAARGPARARYGHRHQSNERLSQSTTAVGAPLPVPGPPRAQPRGDERRRAAPGDRGLRGRRHRGHSLRP